MRRIFLLLAAACLAGSPAFADGEPTGGTDPGTGTTDPATDPTTPTTPTTPTDYNCVVYVCDTRTEDDGEPLNPWAKAAYYDMPSPMELGKTYVVSVDIKSSDSECKTVWFWPGEADVVNATLYPPTKDVTTEWGTYTWEIDVTNQTEQSVNLTKVNRLVFNLGPHTGFIAFTNLSVKEKISDTEFGAELVVNGDFATKSLDGWAEDGWNIPGRMYHTAGSLYEAPETTKNCIVYTCSEADADHPWTKQACYTLSKRLELGKKYKVSVDIMGIGEGRKETQIYAEDDQAKKTLYTAWVTFGDEWARRDIYFTVSKKEEVKKELDGEEVTVSEEVMTGIDRLSFALGKFGPGYVMFTNLSVKEVKEDDTLGEELITNNADFATASIDGWSAISACSCAYKKAATPAQIHTTAPAPADEVVAVEYYTLGGQRVAKPGKGLSIVRKVHKSGCVTSERKLVK